MAASPILLILVLFLAFFIGGLLAAQKRRRRVVTEPSCGSCGYCVRGLETFTCPECGSDLREVGIITPGSVPPMPRWMRVTIYTAAVAPMVFFITMVLAPAFVPHRTTMSRSRVLFSHAPNLALTVRITETGAQTTWGRSIGPRQAPPADWLVLKLESINSPNELRVMLATGACTFIGADGVNRFVPEKFGAKPIEDWLRVHGFSAEGVEVIAQDIATSADEMSTAKAAQFTRFTFNNNGRQRSIAHPASPPLVMSRPTTLGNLIPAGIAAAIWLIGLPFVWRRKPAASPAVAIPAPA